MDNLRNCELIAMDWCYIRKKSGESVDHLLLNCEVETCLWADIFNRTELILVLDLYW